MRHLDLFSGIGGFALAAQANGHETVCFVEIDKFCQRVLAKNFPGVPIVEDVHDIEAIKRVVADADQERRHAPITITRSVQRYGWRPIATGDGRTEEDSHLILTAGFPCQPFSHAGRRQGARDSRFLWPATLAVITATRPEWVLLENVPGILSMVFPDSAVGVASQATFLEGPNDEIADYDTIIGGIDRDLRQAGYSPVYMVIPACSLGAPHRRDRVWIVANRTGQGPQGRGEVGPETATRDARWGRPADSDWCHAADASHQGLPEREVFTRDLRQKCQAAIRGTWDEDWYEAATRFCRMDDGTPRKLDRHRVNRLKALGNAIVWPIAAEIMRGML